ncbi:MAG: COR domain-containing protein [Verrucomicrobiota bacterium]
MNILSLSKLDLTALPPEIGQLTTLTRLDVSNNQLTALPPEIGQLMALKELFVSDNQLTALPPEIGQLMALKELFVSDNQLTALPPEIGQLTALGRLDASNNQLTALPPEIGQLTALWGLYVNENKLKELPPEIGQLALTEIKVESNQLTALPPEIGQLTALKLLFAFNNQLKELPQEIGKLTALTTLWVFNNQLEELPPEIGQLALIDFRVFKNKLISLPPEIGQLTALRYLIVSSNQLATLPPEIGQLTALTDISVYSNQLKELPREIGQLTSLTQLWASDNQLKELPREMGQLTSLTQLQVDNNQLTALPPEIERLTSLMLLDASDNQLTALPESLRKLPKLRKLLLHGNEALSLPQEVLGPKLTEVDCEIDKIPDNCPALLDYYFARQQGGERPLNEVKLLLIGRGGVGKTATMNRLLGKGFVPGTDETLGIEISDWELPAPGGDVVRVHGWDFAGQTVTHGLHKFFLSHRSIYILVLSGREESAQEDAEYWLKLMEAYAKGAEDGVAEMPPVLIALNQWERGDTRAKVDREGLQEKYPWIAGWVETDCKTGLGFDHGKARLPELLAGLAGNMAWVRMGFPAAWHQAKQYFSGMKEKTGKDYMPFTDFQKHCTAELGVPENMVRSLAVVLHRLGIALNFGDDTRLCDTTVLNPHWVTGTIYKVLRRAPRDTDAVMTLDHVAEVLPDEPPHMRAYVVELMRRFDLAFPLPEQENAWLVPSRLPEAQPPGIAGEFGPDAPGAEHFTRLRFSVNPLPKMILPSFVTRTHILSDDLAKVRWANGAVLALGKARALVKADHADRTVTITLTGEIQDRPLLASVCRRELAELFREIPGLNPKEELEVRLGVWAEVRLMERLEAKAKARGGSEALALMPVLCGDEPEIVDVRKELNKISPPRVRDEEDRKPSVFISYSHQDERFKDELVMRFKVLQAAGLAGVVWTDRMLEPGEKWDHGITSNLESADMVLLLLSNAALASHYIQKVEVKRALAHHAAGTAVVVPVILERCHWELTDLKHLQAVPKDAKPLREWKPRNAGWFNVMEQLKTRIESMRKPAGR